MKKLILSITAAAFFAACGNPKPSDEKSAMQTATPDTTGFSEYKQWKEQQGVTIESMNELKSNENLAEENNVQKPAPVVAYRQPAPEKRVARTAKPSRKSQEKAVVQAPERTYGTPESGTRNSTSRDETTGATQPTVSSGPDTSNEPVATTVPEVPQTKEKKGWSKAAKGTAMGAGSGAVLGAIISKNKGKGAVIGGIIGAAGGYAIGRSKDKKDGRY
ncbi:MAG TPA: YMGG-like glycine zipper-containing protein [Segetibacter sp.]